MDMNRCRGRIVLLLLFCATAHAYCPRAALADGDPPGVLPLAPIVRPPAASAAASKTVTFEGRDYSYGDAIPLLVGIATDRRADAARRAQAGDRLKVAAEDPLMAKYIPTLMRACLDESTGTVRFELLMCLAAVGDGTTLGFFEHLLDSERDELVRLAAAYALAQWNEQRGVEELVALLHSNTRLAGEKTVRGEAMMALYRLNEAQGWGMPLKSLLKQQTKDDGSDTLQAVEGWLAANRDRFPAIPAEQRQSWRAMLNAPGQGGQPPATTSSTPGTSKPPREAASQPVPASQPTTAPSNPGAPRAGASLDFPKIGVGPTVPTAEKTWFEERKPPKAPAP